MVNWFFLRRFDKSLERRGLPLFLETSTPFLGEEQQIDAIVLAIWVVSSRSIWKPRHRYVLLWAGHFIMLLGSRWRCLFVVVDEYRHRVDSTTENGFIIHPRRG